MYITFPTKLFVVAYRMSSLIELSSFTSSTSPTVGIDFVEPGEAAFTTFVDVGISTGDGSPLTIWPVDPQADKPNARIGKQMRKIDSFITSLDPDCQKKCGRLIKILNADLIIPVGCRCAVFLAAFVGAGTEMKQKLRFTRS